MNPTKQAFETMYQCRQALLAIEQIRDSISFGGEWLENISPMVVQFKHYFQQCEVFETAQVPDVTTALFIEIDTDVAMRNFENLAVLLQQFEEVLTLRLTILQKTALASARYNESTARDSKEFPQHFEDTQEYLRQLHQDRFSDDNIF